MNTFDREQIEGLAVRLRNKGGTVATAESLTGGRVASALTSVSGSSAYFQGAIVAYSNQLKVELLGVPLETILKYGAVSEECARAMAEGVRRKLGVDLAVATTGIAGPDGGSPLKSVGLVWLAVSDGANTLVSRKIFDGDRESISSAATAEALLLLSSFV